MYLIRKQILLAAVAGATLVALGAGCAHHQSRPFGDVVERGQARPSDPAMEAPAPASPATVASAAPATPPAPEPVNPPAAPAGSSQEPPTVVAPPSPAAPAVAVAPAKPALPDFQSAGYQSGSPSAVLLKDESGGVLVRNWPVSVSWIPSGDVMAGPTLYHTHASPPYSKRPEWQQGIIQPVGFLIDTLLLPYYAYKTPPWSKQFYSQNGAPGVRQEIEVPFGADLYAPATRPTATGNDR